MPHSLPQSGTFYRVIKLFVVIIIIALNISIGRQCKRLQKIK